MTTALQILEDARDYLSDPDHWTKDSFENLNGQCCAVGALDHVTGGTYYCEGVAGLAFLQGSIPSAFRSVVSFNDHPDTTHQDVLDLFDRAIETARAAA